MLGIAPAAQDIITPIGVFAVLLPNLFALTKVDDYAASLTISTLIPGAITVHYGLLYGDGAITFLAYAQSFALLASIWFLFGGVMLAMPLFVNAPNPTRRLTGRLRQMKRDKPKFKERAEAEERMRQLDAELAEADADESSNESDGWRGALPSLSPPSVSLPSIRLRDRLSNQQRLPADRDD